MLHPAVLGVFGVPHLIHHRQRVAAVGIDRVIQTRRGAHCIQRPADLLQRDFQLLGNFLQRRLSPQAGDQGFLTLKHPVGHIPDGTGDPDDTVVPQIPPHLSRDHGHAVGGKAHLLVRVKIGDGLDKADAPHLKQIVGVFAPLVKALYDTENQPQISFNEFFPGVFVARLRPAEQGVHFNL